MYFSFANTGQADIMWFAVSSSIIIIIIIIVVVVIIITGKGARSSCAFREPRCDPADIYEAYPYPYRHNDNNNRYEHPRLAFQRHPP
jgi:hypothetical protein